jgi:hypothetical protein
MSTPLLRAAGDPATDIPGVLERMAAIDAALPREDGVAYFNRCGEMGYAPERETPQYRDYDRTNDLLEQVQGQIKHWFSIGLIASVDNACGKLDDALAMWSIKAARRFAWAQAEALWQLRDNPHLLAGYRQALERMVGFSGRGLLL